MGTAMEQKWNLIKIHELCKDDTKVIEFIKTSELIKTFVKCEKCQSVMEMKPFVKGKCFAFAWNIRLVHKILHSKS